MNNSQVFIKINEIQPLGFIDIIKWILLIMHYSLNPSNKLHMIALANFYYQKGWYKSAEDQYSAACGDLQISDPISREALYGRAICSQRNNDHETALGLLKLSTLKDSSHRILFAMAISFESIEKFDQAEIVARAAYLTNPSDSTGLAILGRALAEQGKLKYARITYETLLKRDELSYLPAYQNLFEILCYEKDFEEAIEWAKKMLDISSNIPSKPDLALTKAFYAILLRLTLNQDIQEFILRNKGWYYFDDLVGRLNDEMARFEPSAKKEVIYLRSSLFPNYDTE